MKIKDAERLCQEKMNQHLKNAVIWTFGWYNSIATLGRCRSFPFGGGEIQLNEDFVVYATEDEVLDVILHEIAHAMTPKDGHGWRWKQACRAIGAHPARLAKTTESVVKMAESAANYIGVCPSCGQKSYRQKMTARATKCHCSKCVSRQGFTEENKITWRKV